MVREYWYANCKKPNDHQSSNEFFSALLIVHAIYLVEMLCLLVFLKIVSDVFQTNDLCVKYALLSA